MEMAYIELRRGEELNCKRQFMDASEDALEKDPKSVGLNRTLINLLTIETLPQKVLTCLNLAITNVVGANKL